MIRLVEVELRKLRGSLILLLVLAPPLLPGLLIALAMATNEGAPSWGQLIGRLTVPLWAMFLNPILLATVATLMGQIEYRSSSWSFMLVQPQPRWQVFLTKLGILWALHILMVAVAIAGAILAGLGMGYLTGQIPTGIVPLSDSARFVALMSLGSLGILSIQLWVALRWNNFVVSLALGIGGTLVALAVLLTGTDQASWFPWVIALRSATADTAAGFVQAGALLGLALSPPMLFDLQRRAFR
ncbi:ABC transporter permease [Alteriqipengyuania sp. 357]